MKEKLLAILKSLKEDVDFESQTAMVDDGVIDSLTLTSLIVELEDAFGIEVDMEELVPENFNTVDAMLDMISRLQ